MVSTEIKDISSCKKALKIALPVGEIDKIRELETRKVQKEAQIPGFRKGHAPRKRVVSLFADIIEKNTLQASVEFGFREAVTQEKIRAVGSPELLKLDYDEQKNLLMDLEVEVFPEIELKKYTGLKFEKTVYQIEDEDVEDYINQILKRHAVVSPVTGAAEAGNYLLVDMQELDETGLPLIGKKYGEIRFQLGSGQFDEQIEQQLIGVKPGEVKSVEKRNTNRGRSQKQVENFAVTVREIQSEELPQLDNDFVKDLNVGVETVDEFKDRVRAQLEYQWGQTSEERFYHQMAHELLQQTPFDVPQVMVDDYLERIIAEMRRKDKNLDEESARKGYRTDALFNIKWFYLKQKIAQVENITVGDEDYQAFIAAIEDEKVKKFYQSNPKIKNRVFDDIFEKKVFDFLVNNSNIKTINQKLNKRKELAGV
jgi:trigger factor